MSVSPEFLYLSEQKPREARWRLQVLSAGHGVTHMRGAVLPLIYPMLMRTMGFGYVDLGIMLTITRLIGGLLQGIWGAVARYVSGRDLIVYENIGVGLGIGLCGLVHNLPELTGVVTLGQVAASPHHPIGSAMLSKWFSKKKRGAAQSFHFAAANVATVLAPLVATFLLKWVGWRDTVYLFMIPAILIAILIWFGLPSEMVAPKAKPGEKMISSNFFVPLKDPLVRRLITVASITAGGKGIGILQIFLPLYLINQLHLSASITGIIFTIFSVASVVGPLLAGRLSDKYTRAKFLGFLLFGACILSTIVALWHPRNIWVLAILLLVMGLFVYGYSPVEQTIVSDITSSELQASAYSLFFGTTYAISALWPLALSLVVMHFGFTVMFLVIASSYLVGGIIYVQGKWTSPPNASNTTASN